MRSGINSSENLCLRWEYENKYWYGTGKMIADMLYIYEDVSDMFVPVGEVLTDSITKSVKIFRTQEK